MIHKKGLDDSSPELTRGAACTIGSLHSRKAISAANDEEWLKIRFTPSKACRPAAGSGVQFHAPCEGVGSLLSSHPTE